MKVGGRRGVGGKGLIAVEEMGRRWREFGRRSGREGGIVRGVEVFDSWGRREVGKVEGGR